jgi:putative endonuclease
MSFYVYMLASQRNGTLYIGHTDDMWARIEQHRNRDFPGFTARYGVTRLVWYQTFETREDAFKRERQMKKWNRAWKIELIERFNPAWADLADDLLA